MFCLYLLLPTFSWSCFSYRIVILPRSTKVIPELRDDTENACVGGYTQRCLVNLVLKTLTIFLKVNL